MRSRDAMSFVAGSGAAPGSELTAVQIAAHDRQRELGADGERQLIRLFGSVYPAGGLIADAGGGTGLATPAPGDKSAHT